MGLSRCVVNAVKRFWVCLAGLICLAGASDGEPEKASGPPAVVSQREAGLQQANLSVELTDPVFADKPARVHRVVQFKDGNGFTAGYAMRVTTEVCTDKKCKIVEVTMYWNAVGDYERLECPPGNPLTKKEHVPFTAADYAKLDGILKDRESILARHSLAFLAKPVETDLGIDALSGATPLTVQESVVQDAAYTSWALWHWANGEIVQKLRGLTEQSCTLPYLRQLLRSQNRSYVDFALKHILAQRPLESQLLDDVLHVLEHGDREQIALSLQFVTGAARDKQQLHARLIESYGRMKSMYSPLILDYFAAQPELPWATLEGLTTHLDRLPYFQVHLILRLLEERKFFSKKTESDVVRLLNGDDFFIARRASEHLLNQDLSGEVKEKVHAFRQRNRDRL
ncbi:MAG TPA: hypothetical protein PLF81_12810 [Candidatus Anammoximicrobium sp.]|nr:hypothetical protein [Candidatus Anammoximicrobium sp.]